MKRRVAMKVVRIVARDLFDSDVPPPNQRHRPQTQIRACVKVFGDAAVLADYYNVPEHWATSGWHKLKRERERQDREGLL